MVNDPFKVKDPTYDSAINAFIYRVYNEETGDLVNITMSDRAGSKENTSYISFVKEKSKKDVKEIVELNKPTQDESYKAVFDAKAKAPDKVFHKKNIKDKWQQLVNPSKEVVDYIQDERIKLKSRISRRETEAPALFLGRQ